MIHEIKILPIYYEKIKSKSKTFELRYNDRYYKLSDYLYLKEYDNGFSGRSMLLRITDILYDYQMKGIEKGYCIISFKLLKHSN